jgi:hypothetical protein
MPLDLPDDFIVEGNFFGRRELLKPSAGAGRQSCAREKDSLGND